MVEALNARAFLSLLGLARTSSTRINAFSISDEEHLSTYTSNFPIEVTERRGCRTWGIEGTILELQGQAYNSKLGVCCHNIKFQTLSKRTIGGLPFLHFAKMRGMFLGPFWPIIQLTMPMVGPEWRISRGLINHLSAAPESLDRGTFLPGRRD